MAIDYLRLLRELVEERESWVKKRDDAERELSRLAELIRSTVRMLPEQQRLQCGYDELLERIDRHPRGLTFQIRAAFTAGKEWLTPVEIRDYLKNNGFTFEEYRANPLASIHTTLKRMVPHEVECQTVEGQKRYRLRTAGEWMASLTELQQWIGQSGKAAVLSGTPNALLTGTPFPVKSLLAGEPEAKTARKKKDAGKEGE